MKVFHIAGAPGSGKTYFGDIFRNNKKCTVYDIDDIYMHCVKHYVNKSKKQFVKEIASFAQKVIDRIVDSKTTNIIFVGINYPDPRVIFHGKEIFLHPFKLNMHADYNIYLNVKSKVILERLKKREEKRNGDDSVVDEKEEKANIKWWKKKYKGYSSMTFDKAVHFVKNKISVM